MLRIIGGTKKTLLKLASLEAIIISALGACIGTVFSCIIVVLFNQAIITGMKMPFLNPPLLWMLVYALGVFILISVIGPFSVFKTIYGFAKKEPALSQG